MQITIKDTLIKQILANHVEECLERRNSKLVNEIMSDSKFQTRLAKELGEYFSELDDIIEDLICEVPIPQLTQAVRQRWSVMSGE